MLKTNSKKAAENIRAYIVYRYYPEGRTDNPPQEFSEIAAFILDTFRSEKYGCPQDVRYYHGCERLAYRSAVDDLGAILKETEQEKARYTEQRAERLLTDLIYRELLKGAAKK